MGGASSSSAGAVAAEGAELISSSEKIRHSNWASMRETEGNGGEGEGVDGRA